MVLEHEQTAHLYCIVKGQLCSVFSPLLRMNLFLSQFIVLFSLFHTSAQQIHLIYFHSRGVFSSSSSNITCHFPRAPFLFFCLHLENAFHLFFCFTTPHQCLAQAFKIIYPDIYPSVFL